MMDRAIVDNFPGADAVFPAELLAQLRAQPRPSPDAFFALLDAGVNVSLGSDGCASTVTCNMLNVLGSAAALSKIRDSDYSHWLSAAEALRAGTVGGAAALGLGGQPGAIAPGYRADLFAYRTDTIGFTPLTDPVRQLVYAERGASIDSVFVAGEAVMRDGRLTRVNERALLREIGEAYEALGAEFELADQSVAPLRTEMEKVYQRAQALHVDWLTHEAQLPG
jgi:guanine deaminase